MDALQELVGFVGSAVWNVWPMFLISIILSVLIRQLKLDGLIRRAFSANIGKAIVLATLVGAFSPFCSCTVVPIIAGLLLSGVPLAPVMAFWIASPTMDPEIFALSVGILGWPMALARLGATLAVSLAAGFVTLALTRRLSWEDILPGRKGRLTQNPARSVPAESGEMVMAAAGPAGSSSRTNAPVQACSLENCGDGELVVSAGGQFAVTAIRPEKETSSWMATFRQLDWSQFAQDVARESWNLGRWLLLAFVLEALIIRYVPQAAIASFLGADSPFAIPLAALIGIPLYLNNLSALPIVSGMLAQGMQPGAAIAFLIAGPVTTIPAMTAVYGTVRRHVFVLYVSFSLLGAILMGFVANLLL